MSLTKHRTGAGVQQPNALVDADTPHQIIALHFDAHRNVGRHLPQQTLQGQLAPTRQLSTVAGLVDEQCVFDPRPLRRGIAQLVPTEMTRVDQGAQLVGPFTESNMVEHVDHDDASRCLGQTGSVTRRTGRGPCHVLDADGQPDRAAPLDHAPEFDLGTCKSIVTDDIRYDQHSPRAQLSGKIGQRTDVGPRTDPMDLDVVQHQTGCSKGGRNSACTGGIDGMVVRQTQADTVEPRRSSNLDQVDRSHVEHGASGQVKRSVEHRSTLGAGRDHAVGGTP